MAAKRVRYEEVSVAAYTAATAAKETNHCVDHGLVLLSSHERMYVSKIRTKYPR